jgi:hypothetical protein
VEEMKALVAGFTSAVFVNDVCAAIDAEADKYICTYQTHIDLMKTLTQTDEVVDQIENLQSEISHATHWRNALKQAVVCNKGKLRS